jgi:hypothetical protein
MVKSGAPATPALIHGGLGTGERWRSVANDGELLDDIEAVTVCGSTVEVEYSEDWARRHRRSPTVVVTKDALKKALRVPKGRTPA